MSSFLQLQERGTTLRREILAGFVTFATMAYIMSIQPAIMCGQMLGTDTGLDVHALVTTTCIASAVGCFLMGLVSRYPFAMAPGMGMNVFVVCELFPFCAQVLGGKMGDAAVWQLGLGVVFIAGAVFFLLSLLKLRAALVNLVSDSMKMAMCAGIGLFLAVLGLENGGVLVVPLTVTDELRQQVMGAGNGDVLMIPGLQTVLGNLMTIDVAIFALGLFVAVVLIVRKVPGAILFGMIAAAIAAFFAGKMEFTQAVGMPADPMPIIGKLDIWGVFHHFFKIWPFIFALVIIGVFDTFGTALSVCLHVGAVQKDGTIPRLDRIFLADSGNTMLGAFFGHSTMTIYLESIAGVKSGGRTGIVSFVVGVLFLLSLFFTPLFVAISSYGPITASVLVLIGVMMAGSMREIQWDDMTEAMPAFMTVVGIPLFHSISDGILFGLILYPFLKLFTGRARETSWGMYVLSLLLLSYVVFGA